MQGASWIAAVLAVSSLLAGAQAAPKAKLMSRFAFGSCTEFNYGDDLYQIFTQGVIPAEPDAWLWNGDLAYLDSPGIDCGNPVNAGTPGCSCVPDGIHYSPFQCLSGDLANGIFKMRSVLESPGYAKFLDYMCPGYLVRNQFPPLGRDPRSCPRPIFGVWDDHDYGWNNGDRRLTNKNEYKKLFLDATGESPTSVRRNDNRGLYDWVVLNKKFGMDKWVDFIMLDERYDRAPLPCNSVRNGCIVTLASTRTDQGTLNRQALCIDQFGKNLADPKMINPYSGQTPSNNGACCKRDEDIAYGWCLRATTDTTSALYTSACDPTSSMFGKWPIIPTTGKPQPINETVFENAVFGPVNWAVDYVTGDLKIANEKNWREGQEPSGFCEMLGVEQREWMDSIMPLQKARVQVYGSGSVLLGSPDNAEFNVTCSNDDWDCWTPAQINLMHKIANGTGCPIVLVGDYHYADIKMVDPASTAVYAPFYKTAKLQKPIYQLMSSGMSIQTSNGLITTAGFPNTCTKACCRFQDDTAGLRPFGDNATSCSAYGFSNFGMLDFNWDANQVTMKVMKGDGTGVARGVTYDPATNTRTLNGPLLQLTIDLDTCQPVGL